MPWWGLAGTPSVPSSDVHAGDMVFVQRGGRTYLVPASELGGGTPGVSHALLFNGLPVLFNGAPVTFGGA